MYVFVRFTFGHVPCIYLASPYLVYIHNLGGIYFYHKQQHMAICFYIYKRIIIEMDNTKNSPRMYEV